MTICFVVLLLTLASPRWGLAQNLTQPPLLQDQTQPENIIDGFPVILDGKPLLFIRHGFPPFSAKERANTIARRITGIAENNSIPVENLKIVQNTYDDSIYLAVDKKVILTVTERDAKANRSTPEVFAQDTLSDIKSAIIQYRQDRRPERLLRNIIYTVLASFTFLSISFAVIKLSEKLFPIVGYWIQSRISGIYIQKTEIISSTKISLFWLQVLKIIRLFILSALLFYCATFVLRLFPWTRVYGERILGYISQSLELVLSAIGNYLPNLVIILIIILITYYIIRLIEPFFAAIESGHLVIPGFYADWAKPTYNITLVIIMAIAAVLAFPYLPGFSSPAFQGISVFLGLLLSLGSTSAITNVIGGIILIYTRAFRIGDHIQVGDVIGDIIEKNFLVVRICTPANEIITIPNSSLLSNNVINFSISARELDKYLVLQTTITLGYDLPWRKTHSTLIEAALRTEHILNEPAPFVLQTSLDNSYISYQLNAFTNQPNLMVFIYSELHQNIQDKCNELGIEILSPIYTSLRDGNATTVPESYLPSDYVAPVFRVESSGDLESKTL